MAFYDGTRLLSMKDLNGNTPEIFMCTSNRSAGKTTYFNRLMVNRFLKSGQKFMLVYRFNYELDDCADKFFKDVRELFFKDKVMTSKKRATGIYHELFLDGVPCGYAISLNSADQIKKYSHFFSDTAWMLFDEFQSETNHYCQNEVRKLISVHTSVARGGGKQARYVPVYMLSNCVSLLNPYFAELGVSERLNSNTHFLRGDGWVLESGFVESASQAQKESLFNRAFSKNTYAAYAAENVYLNDSNAFVEKMNGRSVYIATIKFENDYFAIREFGDQGIVYVDDRYDPSFPKRIALTTEDHQINYIMIRNNDLLFGELKALFKRGCFRFKNLRCKAAIVRALSV